MTRPITFVFSLVDAGTIEDCNVESEVPQAATHLWPTIEQETFIFVVAYAELHSEKESPSFKRNDTYPHKMIDNRK